MKRIWILTLTVMAGAGALHLACSSDDTTGTTNGDAGTTTSSSGGGSNSATSGAPVVVDTCRPAGGSCLCDCKITGQTEDKQKTCGVQAGGNGECRKVCCTGEGTTTSSSGTSGTSGDSGSDDAG